MAAATTVGQDVAALRGLQRVLGDLGAEHGGPTLVCVGGLHGNEPSGVHALRRVVARLAEDATGLRGRLLALAGNLGGLAADRRYVEHDLNRAWTPERLARVLAADAPLETEDAELLDLEGRIARAVDEAPGYAAVLDLHSTSGGGPAFVTMDDTLANRALAFQIPAPHVLGLEEELPGTMLSYWIARGVPAVGFESGQHADPGSVARAEAAVWVTLETAGVLARGRPEVAAARGLLRQASEGLPEVVEVRYREHVRPGAAFTMDPGWASFQPVRRGQRLARSGGGEVTSPEAGLVLMPLYQRQGEDGFFIIRPVRAFWLRVSAGLRRVRAERWAHWMPGVHRHPDQPRVFTVDRRRARWLALEVFHLLGYRRRSATPETLVVTPREPRRRRPRRPA